MMNLNLNKNKIYQILYKIEKIFYLRYDYMLHSFYGTLIFIFFGFYAVLIIAILKELYDLYFKNEFDIFDIFFTVIIPILLYF